MSLDLSAASKGQFSGVIEKVELITRGEQLGDRMEKFLANMKPAYYPDQLKKYIELNPDDEERAVEEHKELEMLKTGLWFHVNVDDFTFDEWMKLPQARGYSLSNLKKVIDISNLEMVAIPENLGNWVGKPVKVTLNKENFYRLSK